MLGCFGDSCKDFDIIEDSDFGAALIKEGFTLEFMKNALIKPVLSLKNKNLLLDWWKQVEGGNPDAPLPQESEIFKSINQLTENNVSIGIMGQGQDFKLLTVDETRDVLAQIGGGDGDA